MLRHGTQDEYICIKSVSTGIVIVVPPPSLCQQQPGVQVVEKLCLAGADTTAYSTGENPLWIALGQ